MATYSSKDSKHVKIVVSYNIWSLLKFLFLLLLLFLVFDVTASLPPPHLSFPTLPLRGRDTPVLNDDELWIQGLFLSPPSVQPS